MKEQISQEQAQKAFDQEVESQLIEWQNETFFDKSLLPENFSELVKEVFMRNSPMNLRLGVDAYKQIVTNTSNIYTFMEMGTICHTCKLRNAYDMGMEMAEYVEFQEGIEGVSKKYLVEVTAKQKSIQGKLMATIRAEKNVPEHKRTVEFNPPAATA